MNPRRLVHIACFIAVAHIGLAARLFAADKEAWTLDKPKASTVSEIDVGVLGKITPEDNTKLVVVSGTLSHADLKKAKASEDEITLSCKVKDGAAVFTVQPVAIGLVRTKQTTWLTARNFEGTASIADERKTKRIELSRKKDKPAILTLKAKQSNVSFAFPIPKDGTPPFEFRIGDLKTSVSFDDKKGQ